ncbi:hypothetical protein GCM10023340_22290 [Nocardioides marinquilinus]|uniref:Lipoprotein n=1 Tax=Nocardioides marinquilinus TaxID=1210400 RepID=A0ABP9PLL0_9ACTN
MARRLLACVALSLALTACGTDDEAGGAADAPEAGPRTEVDWDAYEPGLQRRIDDLETSGDCDGFAAVLDDLPGESGAESPLRSYVDEAMNAADCHSYG